MVNRGRPSRDCQPCKKRKLRCDLQRDKCGQCRRAGIACFGWPEPNALMIRDETISAQQKVLARYNGSVSATPGRRASSSRVSSSASWFPPSSSPSALFVFTPLASPDSQASTPPSEEHALIRTPFASAILEPYQEGFLPASLPLAWEVRARNAFFSYYVFGFSRSHEALTPLFAGTPANSALSAAVDAAALAFLAKQYEAPGFVPSSRTPNSSTLTQLANASYITAIKRLAGVVTAAIRPGSAIHGYKPDEEARGDATLQAVLLLDLYEKLSNVAGVLDSSSRHDYTAVSRNFDGNGPWMSHTRGALDLMRLRGPKRRYSSPNARRLAARLAMTLVISCGATGVHVPHDLEEIRTGLAPYLGVPPLSDDGLVAWDRNGNRVDPKFAVTSVVIGVVNLMADVRQNLLASEDILRRANVLKDQLSDVDSGIPPSWQYERVYTDRGGPLVYAGYYDVYADHYVVQVYNVIRTMRLLLAQLVGSYSVTCISEGDDYTRASHDIDKTCEEICASAPQFFWPDARPENRAPFTPLQSLQCHTLLAPLYIAGQLSTQVSVRSWVLGVLKYMAENGRMRAAKSVADVLQYSPNFPYWHVYAMLGGYAFAA